MYVCNAGLDKGQFFLKTSLKKKKKISSSEAETVVFTGHIGVLYNSKATEKTIY